MKLSIVIPCYNVEKYLEACIKSVIESKCDNIEIILVNDGSTDSTLDIINKYSKEYSFIKVVDKSNGGLSSARNAGIKVSKGDYITFIDSDDTIDSSIIKKILNVIDKGDYDLITYGVKMIYKDHTQDVDTGLYTTTDKNVVKTLMPNIYPAACNKVFKRNIFGKNLFKEGIYYEDVEFIYRALPDISSIYNISGYYYNYYQREGSITYTFNNKIYDMLDNLDSIVNYYKDNNLLDEYHDEIEYAYVRYSYATFLRRLAKCKNKKEFNKGVREAILRVKTNFPEYKKNKYFIGKKGLYLKYFNKLFANIIYIHDKNKLN